MYNIVYFYVNVYNVSVYNLNLTLIVQCKLTNLRKKVKKKGFEGEYTALERLKGVFTKLHKLQNPHQNRLQNGITAPHRK